MKRALDLLVLVATAPFWVPTILLVALLVGLMLGRPVLFSQLRPGLGGRLFRLHKFRTMTDARGSNGMLLPDNERLTRFGRLLRSTSLDELPSLLNLLRGDITLVGPRPLLPAYLPLYSPEQMRRHEVRPGITGWAQVNGRNRLDWDRRLALDTWYVDHRSLALDLRILAMTLIKVIRRDGISEEGGATMSAFKGSDR